MILAAEALFHGAGLALAVRTRPQDDSAAESDAAWELVEPHFVAHVELPQELRHELGTGQLGNVRLTTTRRSLGEVVSSGIADWIDARRPQR